jgi:DNA-binding response OmpR family regulator
VHRERILVVEDDVALASALETELGRLFDTRVVHRGRDALFLAETERFDAIVLDLNLPDIDGLEVADALRANDAVIIMLTARADVRSRVEGLYAGASDYLAKPFVMEELVARLRAQLRRRTDVDTLRHGSLTLDRAHRTCSVDDAYVPLTALEYRILELLLAGRGRIYSRESLEDRLYEGEPPGSNAVEVLVSRLRSKLADVGMPGFIHTVRGLGYVIRERS